MKRRFIPLVLIVLLIVTCRVWLPFIGTFLIVPDKFEKSDVIVLLRGRPYFVIPRVLELYREGLAKRILYSPVPEREKELSGYYNFKYQLSGGEELSKREFMVRALDYFGKDADDIYTTEAEITSTFDEAVATKQWMLKNGFRSMIVVTSGYHMRRALIIFKLTFRGTGIRIDHATAKNSLLHDERWWQRERDVKAVFLEYLSIGFNLIYHFILNKGTTSFDTF